MTNQTFSQQSRVKTKAHFNYIFKQAKRIDLKYFFMYVSAKKEDTPKMAFVAGRKMGKAVQRNRAKRRLRDMVRTRQDHINKDYDLILIAKKKIQYVSLQELSDVFEKKLIELNLWE